MKAKSGSTTRHPAQEPTRKQVPASSDPGFAEGNASLLSEILENTTDAVCMLDYEWRFIYMNACARAMISGGKDLIGRSVWDEFPASTEPAFWTNYHLTMEERVPTKFVAFYGEPLNVWFDVHSYPTLRGMSIFFRDVTARMAEEERLRLLEQAVASSPMGITIAAFRDVRDCPIIYANAAFEELTGYSRDEVLGVDCRFLQGSDVRQSGRTDMQTAIELGQPARTVIRNYRKDGTSFLNEVHLSQVYDHAGRVSHVVGIQNDVTEQLEIKAKLARQAEYDALTGLANRYLLLDRLKDALATAERKQISIAVAIYDLDNFKHMNDRLGHIEADRLLVQIARRLNATVSNGDTVARLGGDEFALILTNWTDGERLHKQMERLLQEIRKPMECGNAELIVTGSGGVAVYPQDATDAESLLQMADLSMYWVKRCGKNSFRLYSPELRSNDNEALDVAVGFRKALSRQEFELYYQPRVHAKTKRVTGFEALIRWHHPTRGLLMPAQFIGVAEDTGLIHEIGAWVLEHALTQAAAWRAEGLEPGSMSVNVSPAQIRDPGFPALVASALAKTGMPPNALELELTESILIENAESAEASLQELRRLGTRVAIDDFGSGFSGLHYLSRFAVDTIKIDHFFTRKISTDKAAATICHSVLKLGQSLGLLTVAEGVETKDQATMLRRWRCGELQGFLFGVPLPAGEARRSLTSLYRASAAGAEDV